MITPRTDVEVESHQFESHSNRCHYWEAFSRKLEREINLLTAEVDDLKKQLSANLDALQRQHANYVALYEAVMGNGCDTSEVKDVVQIATEQRELAEMFREAKK